jgi:hypothetical protein
MNKKILSSANKFKHKPESGTKLAKSNNRLNSNTNSAKKSDAQKVEKIQQKISVEDSYYNSFSHRNGFQSVDNRKIKRKSTNKNKNVINSEFTVDVNKLDRTVNEIWYKFVNYFNYENTL